eukprot:123856-Prymnesium_polylepis.1
MPKGDAAMPPIRLISSFEQHLDQNHSEVALWDNTLMLTPREHFVRVARALAAHGRPVDVACGLMPGGVAEEELRWRILTLADGVRLRLARLECNASGEFERFMRMLALVRAHDGFADAVQVFAVVNTTEPPDVAWARLERLESSGCQVEVVYFTPHSWFEERPFINALYGWTAADLRRFHERWGGFISNLHLASDDETVAVADSELERSMRDFTQQN